MSGRRGVTRVEGKTARAPDREAERPCRLNCRYEPKKERVSNAGEAADWARVFKNPDCEIYVDTGEGVFQVSRSLEGPGGGIGRRSRLKIYHRKVCGFDPHPGHHFSSEEENPAQVPRKTSRAAFKGAVDLPADRAAETKPRAAPKLNPAFHRKRGAGVLRRSRRWAGNRAVIRRQGGAPRCAFPQVPAAPWWNCRRYKPKPIPWLGLFRSVIRWTAVRAWAGRATFREMETGKQRD